MKIKIILFLLLVFLDTQIFAQKRTAFEFGVNGVGAFFSHTTNYDKINNNYGATNGYLGARIPIKDNSILIYSTYQWLSSRDNFKTSDVFYTSNFIGLGSQFRFWEKKRFRLFLDVKLLTEIYSKNKYHGGKNWDTRLLEIRSKNSNENFVYDKNGNVTNYIPEVNTANYEKYTYRGTKLILDLMFGINYELIHNLDLNLSVGFGNNILRLVQLPYYFSYFLDYDLTPFSDINEFKYLTHTYNIQLGISYSISSHKKSKTEKK